MTSDDFTPADNDDETWVDSADRKVANRALSEHHGEQHLTDAEHDRRRELVRGARTRADLRALFADLPPPHPLIGEVPADPTRATSGLGVVIISGGVIVLGAVAAGWWPAALIFLVVLVVVAVLVATRH